MLFESLIPYIPPSPVDIMIYVAAMMGAIGLAYGVFVEKERRQDLIMLVSSASLFVYALYIQNAIMSIAMGGFALASAIEFIEILLGLHKHNPEELKRYKNLQ